MSRCSDGEREGVPQARGVPEGGMRRTGRWRRTLQGMGVGPTGRRACFFFLRGEELKMLCLWSSQLAPYVSVRMPRMPARRSTPRPPRSRGESGDETSDGTSLKKGGEERFRLSIVRLGESTNSQAHSMMVRARASIRDPG